jgi:twitching motility protein PilT
LVNSLLTAIVRADGDALVMHVGERPYVVAPSGPVELSSRPLTLEAVTGMLGQLLPTDARRALEELGAIEHEVPRGAAGNSDRFTVVAARGGDDIWIEIRRHRKPVIVSSTVPRPERAPELVPAPLLEAEPAEAAPVVEAPLQQEAAPVMAVPEMAVPETVPEPVEAAADQEAPAPFIAAPGPEPVVASIAAAVAGAAAAAAPVAGVDLATEPPPVLPVLPPESFATASAIRAGAIPPSPPEVLPAPIREPRARSRQERPAVAHPPPPPPPVLPPPAPEPAVVLPLARNPVRLETQARPATPARIAGIDRLLRLAAARGANTLYLMSQSRPSVRVDGEIATLEGEPVLAASEVESLLLDLAPERSREALRSGEGTEWMAEVPEVGRIRCLNFRDHRGPGGIFRMISTRPASAEQLGLSREIQALAAEPEGLILVAGPRASGKSTLIASFVDLINRSRNDYVVTIESQIMFAHEGRGCLISQREVRGKSDEVAAVTRGALRENPDVLVIEDLRSPEVVQLALDAVEGGHLVIGAISAHTAAAAIARLIDQSPPERRQQVQLTLAEGLRGVVAQVLLHKSSGGRVAARELLLNTPPIANLIAEGRLSQLPLALDSGRKHGMVPLNDSLAAFVQNGVVDVREAYRKAFERQAFLAVLRREGLDTSFVERLA